MRACHATSFSRSRWAALGAAVAVTLGSGGMMFASAALDSGERSVFVPITPCRVLDTRPAPEAVGTRVTPLGASETHTIAVLGQNGDCAIPADASALSMNVTSINPSAASFLTVFPFGAARPLTSNLNWVAGQAPTPNAVIADIGDAGMISLFNNAGTVDVAVDILGYYVDHNHDDRYYTKEQMDASVAAAQAQADADLQTALDALDQLDNETMFAQVNDNGTLASSSGGVTSTRLLLGQYSVDFGRDVSACAFTATQGPAGSGIQPAASMGVADRANNANAVFVMAFNPSGALDDRAFQLIVTC